MTVLNNVLMHGITDQWLQAIGREGAVYVGDSPMRDDRLVTAAPLTGKFALGPRSRSWTPQQAVAAQR